MSTLESYFLILWIIQFFHSIEELSQGFHKKFPFGTLKFKTFLAFEILFLSFWGIVYFMEEMIFRERLLAFFILLMFANGIWHLVWWGIEKKYVPGVVTAFLFVVGFIIFYFRVLF